VDGAITAFREASNLHPNNPTVHSRLGDALGQKGDFVAAARAWKKAIDLNPDDAWCWYCLADAHLAAGERDAYRQVCADMLNRFAKTQDPGVASRVLYTCLPLPDALEEMTSLLPLAELAATDKANARVLGAALYRAGKYEAALDPLNQGQSRAWDHLFLAMAHHQLGRTEQAREYVKRAIDQIEYAGYPWNERTESEALLREANALIGETAGDRLPP
jgi:Flp pilus assembly protein TadD